MNSTEKLYAQKISKIMRSARKVQGITQIDASKALGINQGTLSKLEQGELIISTPLWFEFCELAKISPRSFLLEYIDSPQPVGIDVDVDPYPNSMFSLPKKYNFSKGSTVRSLRPLVSYAKSVWGDKKFDQFLESKKIDSDLFLILPFQINLQFTYDLLEALETSGHLNKNALRLINQPFSNSAYHGDLGQILAESKNSADLLKSLVRNSDRYQVNFNYSFDKQRSGLNIIGKPAPFLAAFTTTKELALSYCDLNSKFFESSMRILSKDKINVKHSQCVFKGNDSCIYQIHA